MDHLGKAFKKRGALIPTPIPKKNLYVGEHDAQSISSNCLQCAHFIPVNIVPFKALNGVLL
jgi:hypothetical protein